MTIDPQRARRNLLAPTWLPAARELLITQLAWLGVWLVLSYAYAVAFPILSDVQVRDGVLAGLGAALILGAADWAGWLPLTMVLRFPDGRR